MRVRAKTRCAKKPNVFSLFSENGGLFPQIFVSPVFFWDKNWNEMKRATDRGLGDPTRRLCCSWITDEISDELEKDCEKRPFQSFVRHWKKKTDLAHHVEKLKCPYMSNDFPIIPRKKQLKMHMFRRENLQSMAGRLRRSNHPHLRKIKSGFGRWVSWFLESYCLVAWNMTFIGIYSGMMMYS